MLRGRFTVHNGSSNRSHGRGVWTARLQFIDTGILFSTVNIIVPAVTETKVIQQSAEIGEFERLLFYLSVVDGGSDYCYMVDSPCGECASNNAAPT